MELLPVLEQKKTLDLYHCTAEALQSWDSACFVLFAQ